jgi:hypothetical protein
MEKVNIEFKVFKKEEGFVSLIIPGDTLGEVRKKQAAGYYRDGRPLILRLIRYDYKGKERVGIFHRELKIPTLDDDNVYNEQLVAAAGRLGTESSFIDDYLRCRNGFHTHMRNQKIPDIPNIEWSDNWYKTNKNQGGGGLLTFANLYRRALATKDPSVSPEVTIPLVKEYREEAFLKQFSNILGKGDK